MRSVRLLPIIVVTSVRRESRCRDEHALGTNCHDTKPGSLRGLQMLINAISDFWFTVVRRPSA